jgi:hypothetical protein
MRVREWVAGRKDAAAILTLIFVVVGGAVARGQTFERGLDPLPLEVEPVAEAEASYFDTAQVNAATFVPATDERLTALEAELKRLNSAEEKRKADAA